MRILHVLNHVSGRGNGIVNAMLDVAAAQVEAGHTVVVASGGGEHEELLRRLGGRHILVPQERTVVGLWQGVWGLRRAVLEVKPDVVHAHMITGLLLAKLWRGMMGFGLVAHVHNVHQRESRLMRVADRVVVVSEAVGHSMEASGIARAKIRVVVNRPLGSPRLAAAAGPDISLAGLSVVTVAGMFERKGISDLIAAFAVVAEEVPEAHLYLVGDGPDRQRFELAAAATACSDRIHFEGFREYPLSYMRAAEVFVLASRRDSMPLVLLEARSQGCAVITSDADGMPEGVDHGAAGMLYAAGDVGRLTEALRVMLRDAATRTEWKARAQAGLERWQYPGLAGAMDAVYQEIV